MAAPTDSQELNLVPYLDIMINLVLFLLASTALIVPLREAPVLVPSVTTDGPTGAGFLTVTVSSAGLSVLGSDPSVPRTDLARDPATGALPYPDLTRTLRDYKESGAPLADALRVVADRRTPYSEVVATMDAARQDGDGALYPGIELATTGP